MAKGRAILEVRFDTAVADDDHCGVARRKDSWWRRGWGEAKAFYSSWWFKIPTALLATGAAVAGALVPAGTKWTVVLAAVSAAGAAFVLGSIVFVVMVALAPGRSAHAALWNEIKTLKEQVAAGSVGSVTEAAARREIAEELRDSEVVLAAAIDTRRFWPAGMSLKNEKLGRYEAHISNEDQLYRVVKQAYREIDNLNALHGLYGTRDDGSPAKFSASSAKIESGLEAVRVARSRLD